MRRGPARLRRCDLPIDVAFQHLWWDGVRVLLNVISTPQRSERLAQVRQLPRRFCEALEGIPRMSRIINFDALPVAARLDLLVLVDWLVTDWPARFIDVLGEARIGWADFSAAEITVPFWLHSVVSSCLRRRTYRISRDEVAAAMSAAQMPGSVAVSKKKLKSLLGVTESDALNEFLPVSRPTLSDQEIRRLAELIDGDLMKASTARDERNSLLKDACCIAIASWNCVSLICAAKCSLDVAEKARAEWRSPASLSSDLQRAAALFAGWLDEYMARVRPGRAPVGTPSDAAFVTRFGRPCGGNGLAGRFSTLLRRLDIPDRARGARLLVNRSKPGQESAQAHRPAGRRQYLSPMTGTGT